MAEEKNSIFDLASKFGVESPFDNWLKEDETNQNPWEAQILNIQVIPKSESSSSIAPPPINLPSSLFSPRSFIKSFDTYVIVDVTLVVTINNRADRVSISMNKNASKTAINRATEPQIYEADFSVRIPKSSVHADGLYSKEFTFTVEVTDLYTRNITDERSIKVKIDTKGKIGNAKDFNPNEDIKIVIDPGHGYTLGNTGATSKIYTYKIKGNDGEPLKNSSGEFQTKSDDVMNLPQYVIDDPNSWVVSKKEDPKHNERGFVFDVSTELKELLEKVGYTCFITRQSEVIQGRDDSKSRQKRIELANKNNANFFISIHADGANNNTASGSHVIYPRNLGKKQESECIQLGKDIFKFYNVVQVEDFSPKKDTRGLQVLGSSNKTNRKILLELGFVTTPRDSKALFSNVKKIAEQLYQGLVYNIENELP